MVLGMAPDSMWELIFLMVILKIPIVYLCAVVYYAIKAQPRPEEGAAVTADIAPEDGPSTWWRRLHPRRFGPHPHGHPVRTYSRAPRPAQARAETRRP